MPVRRILVVAAATATGKSTFIERLLNGVLPDAAATLGIDDVSRWVEVKAQASARAEIPDSDRIVLHYDLYRPDYFFHPSYATDPALRILDGATVVFVTLWAAPDVLRMRYAARQKRLIWKSLKRVDFSRAMRFFRNMRITLDRFLIADELDRHYREWFEFCRTRPAEAHLVWNARDESVKFVPLDEWLKGREP